MSENQLLQKLDSYGWQLEYSARNRVRSKHCRFHAEAQLQGSLAFDPLPVYLVNLIKSKEGTIMATLYDLSVKDAKGELVNLSEYEGKVLIIVNTATKCGFTPQYEELQELYDKYKDEGFEILDFPCNQFGNQAPGTNEEIAEFCMINFGTKFRQFDKIDVNGENESPLYTWLKSRKGGIAGGNIKWNFTKFLIDRHGNVTARYASTKKPAAMAKDIEKLLKE